MSDEPKIRIDDKEYAVSDLNDEAKAQLRSLQFVQGEIQRLNAQLAIAKTAETAYQRALIDKLPA